MNIQDKQPQEIGVWVKISEDFPDSKRLPYIVKYGSNMRVGTLRVSEFHTWQVTHWLSPQTAVVLSVEEWEKVKKCIEALQLIKQGTQYPLSEAQNALQQLNKE